MIKIPCYRQCNVVYIPREKVVQTQYHQIETTCIGLIKEKSSIIDAR